MTYRKVLYKKWIQKEFQKLSFNYLSVKPGTDCFEEGFSLEGFFHCWVVQKTIKAIIETPEGLIVQVDTGCIKFLTDD